MFMAKTLAKAFFYHLEEFKDLSSCEGAYGATSHI